jgi:hypothetical protein
MNQALYAHMNNKRKMKKKKKERGKRLKLIKLDMKKEHQNKYQ